MGHAAVIFIECGLLFPILPGDSLLFAVGLFIAHGTIDVPLWLACVLLTVAAFLGNVSGYYIGRGLGTTLFTNPNARFLKPKYIEQTHEFFERYGPRALVLARFVPIVRTFITVVAGAGKMDPSKFFLWTGIGAVLWAHRHHPARATRSAGSSSSTSTSSRRCILLVLVSLIPMVVEYRPGQAPRATARHRAACEAQLEARSTPGTEPAVVSARTGSAGLTRRSRCSARPARRWPPGPSASGPTT